MSPPLAHRAQAWAYGMAAAVVSPLDDASAARAGAALGDAVYACAHMRRRIARENLAHAFGAAHYVRPRDVFRSGGRLFVECLRLPRYAGRLTSLVRVDDLDRVHAALSEGRGAILFTGHLGNWELIGPALVARGVPVTLLVGRQRNALVDARLNTRRHALGVDTVPLVGGVRDAVRLLHGGRAVGVLVDQRVRRGGVMVPYFGRLASTGPATARLARATGAPLVPLSITRDTDGVHHTVRIEEAVHAARDADVVRLTAEITRCVEEMVRRAPEQYFWFHRRWKPPSDAALHEARGGVRVEEGETEQPRRILQSGRDVAAHR